MGCMHADNCIPVPIVFPVVCVHLPSYLEWGLACSRILVRSPYNSTALFICVCVCVQGIRHGGAVGGLGGAAPAEESYESLMDSAIREDLQMHSSAALQDYIQAHHH